MRKDIRSVVGLNWWKDSNNKYRDFTLVDKGDLQIDLPSGRSLKYQILNASLHSENEAISRVYIRLPRETSDFHEAIIGLDGELADQSVSQAAKIKQAIPIGIIARESRDFEAQDDTNSTERNFGS